MRRPTRGDLPEDRPDAGEDAVLVARRLHAAVVARTTVQQAVGVLRVRYDLDADAALARLREFAATTGRALVDVATEAVRARR